MNNRALFRLAGIGALVYEFAIGGALYLLDDSALDPAWGLLPETIEWYSFLESYLIVASIVGSVLILMLVGGVVGVLLFRNWGRWLSLKLGSAREWGHYYAYRLGGFEH